MCYAIPGKVVKIKDNVAFVDYFGEIKKAKMDFGKVGVGEYVYAQGGVIVDTTDEEDALKTLKIWKNVFFSLQKKDNELAGNESPEVPELSKEKMLEFLSAEGEDAEKMRKKANVIRKEQLKNSCCVHGIIEFSNYCTMNCHYCGLRKDSAVERYRMSPDEIVKTAEDAVKLGFKALVLQSGEDPYYTDGILCRIIEKIRKMGILVFISIGERPFESYKKFYDAGARGVLLRFETSNPDLYSKIRPGKKLEDRINLIKKSFDMGYIVATGFMIGIPGQTDEDVLNDIQLTNELTDEMFSFGPFIPHKNTPFADAEKAGFNYSLNVIALSRFIAPESKILVTTALETLDEKGAEKGLMSGANSLMIDVTPEKYRKNYDIYPGKAEREESINKTLKLLYSLGRAPTDLGLK